MRSKMNTNRRILAITAGASIWVILLFVSQCQGYALFSKPTDTISVAGDSILGTACTFEAIVMPYAGAPGHSGNIYGEWSNGLEDKYVGMNSHEVSGAAFPINYPSIDLPYAVNPDPYAWYHIAFVYDGSEERLYLDGNLVASRSWGNGLDGSHNIGNAPNSVNAVGAFIRGDSVLATTSFIGLIASLRVSTTARYTGGSYTLPTGDFTSDQYTNLLYEFNEAPGSTTITDLSGNGRSGTLGVGFSGATSPQFVPEPSSVLALLSGLGGVVWKRRKGG